jgi:hypothetical protein
MHRRVLMTTVLLSPTDKGVRRHPDNGHALRAGSEQAVTLGEQEGLGARAAPQPRVQV